MKVTAVFKVNNKDIRMSMNFVRGFLIDFAEIFTYHCNVTIAMFIKLSMISFYSSLVLSKVNLKESQLRLQLKLTKSLLPIHPKQMNRPLKPQKVQIL